jgi:3-dehydroquinate synthase
MSESESHIVSVNLSHAPYQVVVGRNLLRETGPRVAQAFPGYRCVIVTDSNVGPLHGKVVANSLREAGLGDDIITVPAGEASKSMACTEEVCRQMIRLGLDRKSVVIALGGGVVGDLAGFVAAIYYRGVPVVQLPTTIVSQVDSAVGGKTGVNTAEGKNLLGAFHQPSLVLADVETLATLPDREYREGFAEIIKHAAIRDAGMMALIDTARVDRGVLPELIARNVAIKAGIVVADEKETLGLRALLNFGHTIGHAIESAAGYGVLLHGEAISLGLRAALQLSVTKAGLSPEDAEAVWQRLADFALPSTIRVTP